MTKRTEPAPATTGEAAHDPGVVLPDVREFGKPSRRRP